MCGRLRCCLVYEYEQYVEAKKTLPKVGKIIGTPYGEGKVRDVRVLRDSIVVDINGEWKEVFRHEFEPLDELKALQEKAEKGCDRHESGGCDCGHKSSTQSETDQSAQQASAQTDKPKETKAEKKSGRKRNRRSRRRSKKNK
jgi:hypothetical protein